MPAGYPPPSGEECVVIVRCVEVLVRLHAARVRHAPLAAALAAALALAGVLALALAVRAAAAAALAAPLAAGAVEGVASVRGEAATPWPLVAPVAS